MSQVQYDQNIAQANMKMTGLKAVVDKSNKAAVEEKSRYKKKIQAAFTYNSKMLREKVHLCVYIV